MKKVIAFQLILCGLLSAMVSGAQTLEYDVDFTYLFNNMECGKSNDYYCESGTINGVRLTPQIGVGFKSDPSFRHNLMVGIDVLKNFGESSPVQGNEGAGYKNLKLFQEMLLYYNLEKDFGGRTFSTYVGCFSKGNSEGHYSEAMYSDYNRFYDNNYEGLLFKWKTPRLYAELGLDWMGMHGERRRERFQIFTSGRWDISDYFSLGWDGVVYHFAGSDNTPGVVDNNLFNPYFRVNIAPHSGFQDLYAQVGFLGGYQWDRNVDDKSSWVHGEELQIGIKRWNVGLENNLYYGMDLMHYYDSPYSSGTGEFIYGSDLYMGNTFYHFRNGGKGLYDRLEIFYQPQITSFLAVRLALRLHFVANGDAPSGMVANQEVATLIFNLDALRRHTGKKQGSPRHFGEYFTL